MKSIISFLLFVFLIGCSTMQRHVVFRGEVILVDTSPLEVDGSAVIVVNTEASGEQIFYVPSCQPPSKCQVQSIDLLSKGGVKVGDKVEIGTYLWNFKAGSKYIIERPNGYIKKI